MDDPVSNVIWDNMGSDYKNQEKLFSYAHWKWSVMIIPNGLCQNVFSPNSGHSFIHSASKLYLLK